MVRGVLARLGFALLLLVGVLVAAAVDERAVTPAVDAPSTLGRSAALASNAPADEPLAVAAMRSIDDSRTPSGRLAPVALTAVTVVAAAVVWRRAGRPRDATDLRWVTIGTRRRAPPSLRSA